MICTDCVRHGRRAKDSHAAGYCDACGWALILDRDKETPSRIRPSAEAAMAVVQADLMRESPPGFSSSAFEFNGTPTPKGMRQIMRGVVDAVGGTMLEEIDGARADAHEDSGGATLTHGVRREG